MVRPVCVLGRQFESQDLQRLQAWIEQRPAWSRRRLSVALAEIWDWRNLRGQLRDMATRLLLNRLERQGLLRLPARQNRGGRRQVRACPPSSPVAAQPITGALEPLQPLRVELIPSAH